jgi:hypothetical protein
MAKEPFQIVSDKVSDKDLKDEVLRRNSRAGYCTRLGEPPGRTKIMNTAPTEQYRRNYDKIKWES